MDKKRVPVYLTNELNEYVEKQSKVFSMSKSSYICMCIIEYRKNCHNADILSRAIDKLADND